MSDPEVLIVGAGPTGLVLALWLTLHGVRVRIVDRMAAPATTSRALAVQARTVELYAQADLDGEMIARGHKVAAVNFWVRGERRGRVPFGEIGLGLSPNPMPLIFPQDAHEALLTERLTAAGVTVERDTQLVGFTPSDTGVEARLSVGGGAEVGEGVSGATASNWNGEGRSSSPGSANATASGSPGASASVTGSPESRSLSRPSS